VPKPGGQEGSQGERSYAQVLAQPGDSVGGTYSRQRVEARKQAHMSSGSENLHKSAEQTSSQASQISYRERRLILSNSKSFSLLQGKEALELRDNINSDFS
jgi:hypothetical protein